MNSVQFNKKMQEFLKYAAEHSREEEQTIYPDPHGYYKVIVEKESVVPTHYRCYKIKEKLDVGMTD